MTENNQAKQRQTVEVPLQAPPINAGTLTRLILFIVAIINTIARALGFDFNLDVDGDVLYEGFSILLDVLVFGYGFWKNNDITKKARIASEATKQIKKSV